jgi:hypothetical protein
MIQRLTISQILVYYDFPEIFIAENNIGTLFMCLLVSTDESKTEYIATPISNKKLSNFINGNVDLRDIFESPETGQWFLFNNVSDVIEAKYWEHDNLPSNYLPERGFVYHKQIEGHQLILDEVIERKNVVVHLAVSDEHDNFSIEADDLGDIVKLYQAIIENSYKKGVAERGIKEKKFYYVPQNYKLRAFASSNSSFNLHLYSISQIDLFGNSLIEIGLEKFDEIITDQINQDSYIKTLRTVKGHTISSLKKLVKKIIDKKLKIKHKWFSPNQEKVHFSVIDGPKAEKIYEILNLTDELAEETKTFIGYFVQVDIDKGTWRVFNIEDKKEYSGEDTGGHLQGITVETVIYKLTCQEVVEELTVSEKEKVKYILQKIDLVE